MNYTSSSVQVQAETPALPRITALVGLHCRELFDEANLIEVAAPGCCVKCKVPGFFNFMRIMKPANWDQIKNLGVGNLQFHVSELAPSLVISGPHAEYYCPPCHLAYLDPLNFERKEVK